jgi:hypothetical protein
VNARWLATAMIALAACGGGTPAPAPQTPAPAATAAHIVRVRHLPPTAKDVIDAAIESGTVPLSVSATCTSVGTEPTDATIGRYLAGFLAELSSPDKKNWIETKIDTGWSRAGDPVSICTLVIRHEDGDDRWGWGVRFQIRSTDGLVLNDSFTCVGAG